MIFKGECPINNIFSSELIARLTIEYMGVRMMESKDGQAKTKGNQTWAPYAEIPHAIHRTTPSLLLKFGPDLTELFIKERCQNS